MENKNRLKFWHIHCLNCGEKICKYKKEVKNINEIKICNFCGDEIRIMIGCDFRGDIIALFKGNVVLINNLFKAPF